MNLVGLYFGVIEEVWDINHKNNLSKHQYEYLVRVQLINFAQIPVRCVKADHMVSSLSIVSDLILKQGMKVLVQFINGKSNAGVIVGGLRQYTNPIDKNKDYFMSINLVDMYIDKKGDYYIEQKNPLNLITSNILIAKDKIKIGDNKSNIIAEDSIELDQKSQTITIKSGTWNVQVSKNATLNITGDVNIKCKNANIDSANSININSGSDIKINSNGNIDITKSNNINIKTQALKINNGQGKVLTTMSQPTCYVTGIPFKGSTIFSSD